MTAGAQGRGVRWLRGHLPEPFQGIRWEVKENGGERGGGAGEKMSSVDVHLPCLGKSSPAPQVPSCGASSIAPRASTRLSPSLKSALLEEYKQSDSALHLKFCS